MNGWSINTTEPITASAIYFLILESENTILYAYHIDTYTTPMTHAGDWQTFYSSQPSGTPFIPVDTHTALTLGWVDMQRMVRNRPYLDETIKAAIALVA